MTVGLTAKRQSGNVPFGTPAEVQSIFLVLGSKPRVGTFYFYRGSVYINIVHKLLWPLLKPRRRPSSVSSKE